jgi:hypothetical protein
VFVLPRVHRGKEEVHPEERGEKFREEAAPRGGGRARGGGHHK